jgi:hypothetical protein
MEKIIEQKIIKQAKKVETSFSKKNKHAPQDYKKLANTLIKTRDKVNIFAIKNPLVQDIHYDVLHIALDSEGLKSEQDMIEKGYEILSNAESAAITYDPNYSQKIKSVTVTTKDNKKIELYNEAARKFCALSDKVKVNAQEFSINKAPITMQHDNNYKAPIINYYDDYFKPSSIIAQQKTSFFSIEGMVKKFIGATDTHNNSETDS